MTGRMVIAVLILICGLQVHAQERWIEYDGNELNCTFLEELLLSHVDRSLARVDGVAVTLQVLWKDMIDACDESPAVSAAVDRSETTRESDPTGTLDDPYPFREWSCNSAGLCLSVYDLWRPANRIVKSASWLNSEPDGGNEYFLAAVGFYCGEWRDSDCEASTLEFDLVGSYGSKYKAEWFVSGLEFEISLIPGGEDIGILTFQVQNGDSNLMLLHSQGMFSDSYTVHEAEPSDANSVIVVSETNANVRLGPGTDNSVVGTFPTGEQDKAYGRNEDGSWLRIMRGWVYADLVVADGDIMALPKLP